MTRRDNVPDPIVDRKREDTACPSATSVISLNVESATLAVPLIEYRLAGDQQGGGQSVDLLRCDLSGAEQLHALGADGQAGSLGENRGGHGEHQRVALNVGTQQTPDVGTRHGQ